MIKIVITAENLEDCREADSELHTRMEELAALTHKYPVTVEFGGYRFIFRCREDIQRLVKHLGAALEEYTQAA